GAAVARLHMVVSSLGHGSAACITVTTGPHDSLPRYVRRPPLGIDVSQCSPRTEHVKIFEPSNGSLGIGSRTLDRQSARNWGHVLRAIIILAKHNRLACLH